MFQKFGRYILLEKIAVGGMAEIWLAKQTGVNGFEKLVVVKKILPQFSSNEQFSKMFINEAKLASKLNHPNIVQIYDLGNENGVYYIAMEYVLGYDLLNIVKSSIKAEKRLPINFCVKIISQAASALYYANNFRDVDTTKLNIVHRDISPQNILVSYDGVAKVVDFGIAKAVSSDTMTKTGVLKGKYAYMSPEQVMGKKLDGRSDIFSLAIVLYEITVGKRLFKSNSELRVLRKITEDKIEAPIEIHPKYPKVLNDIIMKALSRNRANRYSSGQEFSADLEKYLTESNNMVSTLDISKWLKELFKDEIVQRILNNKKLFNEADVFLEREELHKNKPLEKSETIKKEMKVEFTNEFEFDRNNKESDLKLNFDNLNKEEILNQVNKDPKLPTISIKIKNKKKLTIKNIILSLIMLLLFYILIFSASVGYKIFSSNKYIEKSLSDSVEVDLPGHELNTRMELFCNKKYVYCNKDSIRVLESDKILNLAIEYKVKSKLFGVIPLDFNFNKKLNAAIKE